MTKINPNKTIQQNLSVIKGDAIDGDYAYGLREAIHDVFDETYTGVGTAVDNMNASLQTALDQADTATRSANGAARYAEDAMENANQAASAALAAANNIAEPFSEAKDYSLGEYVLYDGKIYRFMSNYPAGAWSASKVEQVEISGEISELKSAISEKINIAFSDIIDPVFVLGEYISVIGSVTALGRAAATDYILCSQPLQISIPKLNSDFIVNLIEYDNNKEYLRGCNANTRSSVLLGSDTAYYRYSVNWSTSSGVKTMTHSDIDQYFRPSYCYNILTEGTISELVQQAVTKTATNVLSDTDFVWTLGKYININSGKESDISTSAATGYIMANEHTKITRLMPKYDDDNIEILFNIVEYDSNKQYLRGDSRLYGASWECGLGTAYIRMSINRRNASGVEMTQADINRYFAINYEYTVPSIDTLNRTINNRIIGADNKCFAQYYASSDLTHVSEEIRVWTKAHTGYVMYRFTHYIDDTLENNYNIWRIFRVYRATDPGVSSVDNITISGELECAIKLEGRDDFSGGSTHGDEIMTDVVFLLDGKPIDIASLTAITAFNELRICRTSTLYDPANHTAEIAEHGCEYVFAEDGLKINQMLKWLVAEDLENCFLAMCTPAKAVTNKVYTNADYQIIPLGASSFSVNKDGATTAYMYGDTSGVSVLFAIEEYPTGKIGGDKWSVTDNGGLGYNKMYYHCASRGARSSIGELWRSVTIYKFELRV